MRPHDTASAGLRPTRPDRLRSGWLFPYVANRAVQGIFVIFGAIIISFILINITGNPAELYGAGFMTREEVASLEQQLGYDAPLLSRLVSYVRNAAQGDFGMSYQYRVPALEVVVNALPATLALVGGAMAVACAIALASALYSVLHRETRGDRLLRGVLTAVQGVPEFWLGLMLALVFAAWLRLLPSIGFDGFSSLILPVLALALPLTPALVRLLRGELLDFMKLDLTTALRGKGLSDRSIVIHHGLRNVLAPVVTLLALQIGWLLGGTIVVEAVFAWPGIGNLALIAVETRDLTVIQAIVVVVAIGYVVFNLVADLIVLRGDPRIRVATR